MLNVYDLLNLDGKDVEDKIRKSIDKTKEELSDLDTERMCMVYSGYLLDNLRREHAICRLVDTNDLGLNYQHHFILVNNGDSHYLVDLTYDQFGDKSLDKLLSDGYDVIDDEKFSRYLKVVTKQESNSSVRDAFDLEVKIK